MSQILYQQMRLPVFQNKVYGDREEALNALLGDVELIQCQDTGLVHNHLFDPDMVQYDVDYQNEQACSPAFQHHLQQVKECVLRHFGRLGKGVEIGCGKGYFLEMLCQSGADIMGFDPAYEGENICVRKDYFRGKLNGEKPDYIILRHVLEHIARPWDFLDSLSEKSKRDCGIYIEVPCFDWIVANRAFYDIFYEHCNYFNLNVLESAFGSVWKSGRFFGDQYLYVIADLTSFQSPSAEKIRRYVPLKINDLLARLLSKRKDDGRIYVWGGGSQRNHLFKYSTQAQHPCGWYHRYQPGQTREIHWIFRYKNPVT